MNAAAKLHPVGRGSFSAGELATKLQLQQSAAQLAGIIATEARRLAGVRRAWIVLPAGGEDAVAVINEAGEICGSGELPDGLIRRTLKEKRIWAWHGAGRVRVRVQQSVWPRLPVAVADTAGRAESWERDRAWLDVAPRPQAVCLLPLPATGSVAGVLILCGRRRPWTRRDFEALLPLSPVAALALASSIQRAKLEHRLRQSSAMSEIAQNINSTLELDILLKLIILEVTKAMNCQAGDIWLREEKHQPVVFQTSLGLGQESRGLPLAGAVSEQALASGEPVWAPKPPEGDNAEALALRQEGIVSLIAAPLKTKNKVLGVMHLFARQERDFPREELVLLKSLANQAALAIDNARLFNETKRKAQELHGLYEVAQVISDMSNLPSALSQIVERVSSVLEVEKCWLMFYDPKQQALFAHQSAVGAVEEQLTALHRGVDQPGISPQVFNTIRPFYTNAAEQEPLVAAEFEGIFQLRNLMAVPLRSREQTLGVFLAANKREGASFTGNDVRLFVTLASEATVVIHNAQLYDQVRQNYLSMVQLVSKLVDAREPYARGHSGRVAAFAAGAAKVLGLDAAEVEAVTIAGRLHDVGKIWIPAEILLKHGPLTAEEEKKIREHPLLGERLLAKVRIPADILSMIRHHHEAFNGHGYPDGLAGERIPLGARIIAVANAFDVLTSSGGDGRELSHAEAFSRLLAEAGNELDPAVVKAFADVWQHPGFDAESSSPKPGGNVNALDFWAEDDEEGW